MEPIAKYAVGLSEEGKENVEKRWRAQGGIAIEELRELCPDLYGWIAGMSPQSTGEEWLRDVLFCRKHEDGGLSLELHTRTYRYHIGVTAPKSPTGGRGLLFSFTSRKANVGETHLRGRDLNDGPYDKSTWDEFVRHFFEWEVRGRSSTE